MQSLVPINYKNTVPHLKTKQHKTNIEVKKGFLRVTQIIFSNYKMYIMTYM